MGVVRFRFANRKLEQLYTAEAGAAKYPPHVLDAFFEVMEVIRAAPDERDLYVLKSLRYEKLKGKRKHQRSLRLGSQYRLVVQRLEDEAGLYLLIEAIEDYH